MLLLYQIYDVCVCSPCLWEAFALCCHCLLVPFLKSLPKSSPSAASSVAHAFGVLAKNTLPDPAPGSSYSVLPAGFSTSGLISFLCAVLDQRPASFCHVRRLSCLPVTC